jgi:hypothetical protein
MTPHVLIYRYRRRLLHYSEDGGSKLLLNVVSIYQSTRSYIPEDCNHHCYENISSRNVPFWFTDYPRGGIFQTRLFLGYKQNWNLCSKFLIEEEGNEQFYHGKSSHVLPYFHQIRKLTLPTQMHLCLNRFWNRFPGLNNLRDIGRDGMRKLRRRREFDFRQTGFFPLLWQPKHLLVSESIKCNGERSPFPRPTI